jgi:hypothetical protein
MTLASLLNPVGIIEVIVLIIGVVFWFVATVFILCIMEVRCGSA